MRSQGIGLVDWYAWKETGEYHNLTEAELKLWTLRLFIDMGLIDAPAVENRSLPDDLPEDAPTELRKVYHGIVERVRIWKLIGGYVPLAHKFLARWCGVSEDQAGKCMQWLLKRFYLKGGVFLRKDGTVSKTRESKMDPECFVMKLEAKAWKPKGKTFIQRTRAEWAQYYATKREAEDAEAIARHDYEEAEQNGDLAEAIAQYEYEEAERRGDFDNLDDADPDAPEPDFELELMDEEPDFDDEAALDMDDESLDPETMAIVAAMGSEVML
jgi:hypothetical protein